MILLAFAICIIIVTPQVDTIVLLTDESNTMYSENQINNDFIIKTDTFDCSAFLYAYSQNQEQFLDNLPSKI